MSGRSDPAGRREYERLWREQHRDQQRQYLRDYHERHKHEPAYKEMKSKAARHARRKAKYGITKDQYAALLTEQKGCCMICGVYYGEDLRVDHDHDTKEIRALLCSNCNSGLGLFQEQPDRLEKAKRYLERYQTGKRI